MLTFNEGKVCDAIVRHLEVREGAIRADVQWPEAVHHVDPVELTWKLGDQLFALEHTGIEPFDDHMRLEAAAKHHFDPVREALKDVLPDEIIDGSARIRSPQQAMAVLTCGNRAGSVRHGGPRSQRPPHTHWRLANAHRTAHH